MGSGIFASPQVLASPRDSRRITMPCCTPRMWPCTAPRPAAATAWCSGRLSPWLRLNRPSSSAAEERLNLASRQAHDGARALAVFPVHQGDFAAMGTRNLLRQREAHTASRGLGGVERHEEVF